LQDERWVNLDIPIGFYNTLSQEDFKKRHNITKVPLIYLYIKGVEIEYHGDLTKQDLLDFVLEKTKLGKVPSVKDLKDLEKKRDMTKEMFLYFGNEANLKAKIFGEGYYHYPN